jgi:hypothetical protein
MSERLLRFRFLKFRQLMDPTRQLSFINEDKPLSVLEDFRINQQVQLLSTLPSTSPSSSIMPIWEEDAPITKVPTLSEYLFLRVQCDRLVVELEEIKQLQNQSRHQIVQLQVELETSQATIQVLQVRLQASAQREMGLHAQVQLSQYPLPSPPPVPASSVDPGPQVKDYKLQLKREQELRRVVELNRSSLHNQLDNLDIRLQHALMEKKQWEDKAMLLTKELAREQTRTKEAHKDLEACQDKLKDMKRLSQQGRVLSSEVDHSAKQLISLVRTSLPELASLLNTIQAYLSLQPPPPTTTAVEQLQDLPISSLTQQFALVHQQLLILKPQVVGHAFALHSLRNKTDKCRMQ